MAHVVSVAEIAALVGDPSRASMLEALMDGRALTAGELARCAGVTPQTASGHLARLAEAGLITLERQGRHRYHRLASGEVAGLLESLAQVAAAQNLARLGRTVRTGPRDAALRLARSCYSHMAGSLAVALTDSLLAAGQIEFSEDGGLVTGPGERHLRAFGALPPSSGVASRAWCRPCLDWSERRPHLAGRVGAAILQRSLELGWLRRDGASRALIVTRAGEAGFDATFGVRRGAGGELFTARRSENR